MGATFPLLCITILVPEAKPGETGISQLLTVNSLIIMNGIHTNHERIYGYQCVFVLGDMEIDRNPAEKSRGPGNERYGFRKHNWGDQETALL
jgi:hypothetical protein